MEKPNSESSPSNDNNETEKESSSNEEQQAEEPQLDQTVSDSEPASETKSADNAKSQGDAKLSKATEPAPVVPSSDDQSIGLDDITSIKFKPPLPSKGPMSDFVAKASADLGLPKSHARAIWIFTTMAHCGHKVYYDDGCVERRIAPNVILAGDDESGIARRIAVEALALKGDVHVLTDPAALQGYEALEAFSADVRRAVIDTGDENIFLKWHKKVSKQVISLSQLFCKDSLNDYLSGEIRAKSMPPVAVPILLSCQLQDILSDRKFPFSVFRDSLVIPSFGCRKECSPNSEKMAEMLKLLTDSLVAFERDIFLVLTLHAQEEMEACLNAYSLRAASLKQEGNHAHFRHTNICHKLLCLAAAYAINDTGADFDGKISKSVMQLAIKAFDQLDKQWNGTNRLYEEAARADEVDTVYEMILAHFSNYYDSELGGLVVPFQELAKAFCHHPVREGQFTTGHLERKVLADLEHSGRAKQLVGKSRRDRKWVFYRKLIGLV